MNKQYLTLAGLILNCKPEDLRGFSLRTDGSLAVIAPNGMKFIFSPVELENARDSFGLPPFSNLPEPIVTSTSKNRKQTGVRL